MNIVKNISAKTSTVPYFLRVLGYFCNIQITELIGSQIGFKFFKSYQSMLFRWWFPNLRFYIKLTSLTDGRSKNCLLKLKKQFVLGISGVPLFSTREQFSYSDRAYLCFGQRVSACLPLWWERYHSTTGLSLNGDNLPLFFRTALSSKWIQLYEIYFTKLQFVDKCKELRCGELSSKYVALNWKSTYQSNQLHIRYIHLYLYRFCLVLDWAC